MNSKQIYLFIVGFSFLVLLASCSDSNQALGPVVDATNNGFETYEVAKVFAEKCAIPACHSSDNPQHGLSFANYYDMLNGSVNRPLDDSSHHHTPKILHDDESLYGGSPVVPYDTSSSLLYNLITGHVEDADLRMPYLLDPLTNAEIELIKNWILNGAKDFQGNVPYAASDYIYACSQFGDKILAVDPASNLLARTIDVNFSSSNIDQPHNVKKFGHYLYASIITAGKFLKIDIPTNTIVGTVDGLQQPGMIEISSDGKKAYVSKSATATGNNNEIYFINTESMTLEETFLLPETGLPHGMAISSDDNFLYVANMTKDKISIVDLTTNEFVENINLSSSGLLEHEPMHLYISPDDNYLYACCRTSSKVLIISTSTRQIIQSIDIQDHPMQAAISNDGLTIYVVSHHEPIVTTIKKDPISESWTKDLEYGNPAFQHLYGADLSTDGKYLYMTCSNEENDFSPHYSIPGVERQSLLCVYDTELKEVVKIIDLGSYATGITAR